MKFFFTIFSILTLLSCKSNNLDAEKIYVLNDVGALDDVYLIYEEYQPKSRSLLYQGDILSILKKDSLSVTIQPKLEKEDVSPKGYLLVWKGKELINHYKLFSDGLTSKSIAQMKPLDSAITLTLESFSIPIYHKQTTSENALRTQPRTSIYAVGEGKEQNYKGYYDGSSFLSSENYFYDIVKTEMSENLKDAYHSIQATSLQMIPVTFKGIITKGRMKILKLETLGDFSKDELMTHK